MAVFAAVRSSALNGEPVGITITASHNPECDNGVKLSDADGGMLPLEWEDQATDFANDDRCVLTAWRPNMGTMVVHVGRDTRTHSLALSQLVVRAAVSFGAVVIDHGCVTTPQLHYFVLRSNPHRMPNALLCGSSGCCFENEYLESIVGSYVTLIATKEYERVAGVASHNETSRTMLVDCACGVGGLELPKINAMLQCFREKGGIWLRESLVRLVAVNLPGDGPLNERCGAEFVQKQQTSPIVYSEWEEENLGKSLLTSYVASLDGDADRIVFHYNRAKAVNGNGDGSSNFVLLDGDKIAVLVSSFLQEEIQALSSEVAEARYLKCGVVQTAYANGSSTFYLKVSIYCYDFYLNCGWYDEIIVSNNMTTILWKTQNTIKTQVAIAKTGVKHVHSTAHDHFDVGIYFEANGHGTVLFGPKYYAMMAKAEETLLPIKCRTNRATIAWQRLRVLPRLINQAVGDALSDLFLVDAILYLKGWSLPTWNGLYKDMPSRQGKVRVKDRNVIRTNDNETRAVSPPALQRALDDAMTCMAEKDRRASVDYVDDAMIPRPRAFVRPSGTEDVVRIYAEAATQRDADVLASEAASLVHKLCDGTGPIPSFGKQSKL
jgi:Phosphomannomutase